MGAICCASEGGSPVSSRVEECPVDKGMEKHHVRWQDQVIAEAEPEELPEPRCEFPKGRQVAVSLKKKDGQELGLLLEGQGGSKVTVAQIGEGTAAEYNMGAKVQDQLHVGDLILEANGIKDVADMSKELSTSAEVELLVECRSYLFKVKLSKAAGAKLGMGLRSEDQASPLVVSEIREGVVQEYNKSAPAEKQVQPGDHILIANGAQEPKARMEELQKATDSFELWVRRVEALPKDA